MPQYKLAAALQNHRLDTIVEWIFIPKWIGTLMEISITIDVPIFVFIFNTERMLTKTASKSGIKFIILLATIAIKIRTSSAKVRTAKPLR